MTVLRVLQGAEPRIIRVAWRSGRVDVLELRRGHWYDADRIDLRRFIRELSDSSDSIERVWAETAGGALLYAAERGVGRGPKRAPMA
jgi:hypothetical protein